MEQLNIPFKLGVDYDNWELDLECLPDRMNGYDSYIYLGKEFNSFLNYPTDKTELIFKWDILEAVIISFNCMEFLMYEKLCGKLTDVLKLSQIIQEHNYLLHKFEIGFNKLWCCYNYNTRYIIVITTAEDSILYTFFKSLI